MPKRNPSKIHFHYLLKPFHFPRRIALKRFLLQQIREEKKDVEAINYIFCTDEYLLQINQAYLKHNTYTDIITFELSQKNLPLLADIYISVERVRENAATYNQAFLLELYRVIFHGCLHLVGYKDKSEVQKKQMRTMESKWLSRYNVPRGSTNAED